jgi:ribosomal protein S18 acetylase RimI-like enzyme
MTSPPRTGRRTLTRLDWDSAFFGLAVGRIEPPLDRDSARAVAADAAGDGFSCVYLRAATDDVQTIQAAESAGFRLVDIRLTFVRDVPVDIPAAPLAADVAVRGVRPEDVAALETIARDAHRDGRFHVDPGFGAERASALYAHWVAQCCANRDGAVFVPEHRGVISGYLTCERDQHGDGRIALVAVSDRAQGLGLGRALVARGLSWFQEAGASRVRVVTQGRNVRAQRVYQRAGFRTESVDVWLHLWPNTAGGRRG